MLTVAARYNGSVQPPGARMILSRLGGTKTLVRQGRAVRQPTAWRASGRQPYAGLASAIRQMRPRHAARSRRTAQTTSRTVTQARGLL